MPWRRLITIPGYLLLWAFWLAATPVWLMLAVAVDLLRRDGGVATRSAAIVTMYLSCEAIGVIISGAAWLWKGIVGVEPDAWTNFHFRLESWWGTTLFRSVVLIFGLRVEVEGQSDADLGRGPYILLPRHSSTADTLLASALITHPYGMRLRYVLKRENLWDPCLDLVGNRVPNVFLDRFSTDSASEVRRLQALARDLGTRDGVLIYPEGTRFSDAKRKRILEKLGRSEDKTLFEYARSLPFVLPPRLTGTLALLEAAPDSDVIVCAHTGLEGTASLADVWKGALLNRVVRIRFRRVPRIQIPGEPDARKAWLLDEWRRVGDWVEQNRPEESGGSMNDRSTV